MPVLFAAESTRFDASLLALGLLLVIGALVSGVARRSFLSLTALFVLIGFGLGPGVTDVIHLDARSSFVGGLATVALIVILFRDGLEVDGEMLQQHWRLLPPTEDATAVASWSAAASRASSSANVPSS